MHTSRVELLDAVYPGYLKMITHPPATVRHTSSWPAHYRGEGPQVQLIQFYPQTSKDKRA